MNRLKVYSKLHIGSNNLDELINLLNINISDFVKSNTEVYGIVAQKLSSDQLSIDLKCEVATNTSIKINEGYIVWNQDGEIFIVKVPQSNIDLTGYSSNVLYYLYIIPQKSNYESGVLQFVNGSKMVSITGGNFNKLSAYEYILINSSQNGNDGLYQVAVINASTLELVTSFTGINESNLKWAIVGKFADPNIADSSKPLYDYDSYSIVISTNSELNGIKLCSFTLDGSPAISKLDDLRSLNLYKSKQLNDISADSVLQGIVNDITTVDEKAQAGSVSPNMKSISTSGVKEGLTAELQTNGTELIVSSGTAYDLIGRRILLSQDVTLALDKLVSDGVIVPGENYLHLQYKSPSSFEFYWDTIIGSKGNATPIALVKYVPLNKPKYSVADQRTSFKLKATSFVSEGKSLNPVSGELFYDTSTNLYYYTRKKTNGELETVQLIDSNTFNSLITEKLNSLAIQEKIRFIYYPVGSKNNWFRYNGYGAPLFIGYQFRVIEWSVGVLNVTAFNATDHTDADYPSKLGVSPVVVAETGTLYKTAFAENLDSSKLYSKVALGLFFKGKTTPRAIQLKINNTVIKSVDMETQAQIEDGGSGSPLNKMYVAEISIQKSDDDPNKQLE